MQGLLWKISKKSIIPENGVFYLQDSYSTCPRTSVIPKITITFTEWKLLAE